MILYTDNKSKPSSMATTTTVLCSCGHHLHAAKLRPSNVDPAAGALELQRIVPQIQQRWPKTQIIVRGDSAYARDEIMSWCEEHNVDYVLGLPVINGSSA